MRIIPHNTRRNGKYRKTRSQFAYSPSDLTSTHDLTSNNKINTASLWRTIQSVGTTGSYRGEPCSIFPPKLLRFFLDRAIFRCPIQCNAQFTILGLSRYIIRFRFEVDHAHSPEWAIVGEFWKRDRRGGFSAIVYKLGLPDSKLITAHTTCTCC